MGIIYYNKKVGEDMKYSKKQKEIIKLIQNGIIFDIPSFVSYYSLTKHVVIDKISLSKKFDEESFSKRYFHPVSLKRHQTNVMTEVEYRSKADRHDINPCSYTSTLLSLKHDVGLKTLTIDDHTFTIDLYNGVNIAESFSEIYEFLILWQHLKNEMLVLECSGDNEKETLSLMFSATPQKGNQLLEDDVVCNYIDYDTFTISDRYLIEYDYAFCTDIYYRCRDFVGKRIYPSMQLSLFVENKFETFDEISQRKSLCAAWIAIWVSILLGLSSYVGDYLQADPYSTYLNRIQNSISQVEKQTQAICEYMESSIEIQSDNTTNEKILKTLQSILQKVSQIEKSTPE